MKATGAAIIGMLALLMSGCITGDEITGFVIGQDGAVAFSTYRLNLTSEKKGYDGEKELADRIRDIEEQKSAEFEDLVKANAKDVKITVLRRAAPASVLITAQIPSLKDLASYLSGSETCTEISTERTRGIRCENNIKPKPSNGKESPEPAEPHANSLTEMRFALAEGTIVKAQGFLVAQDKRSARVDMETFEKIDKGEVPAFEILLEWQIP
jgi:hypothetical protein